MSKFNWSGNCIRWSHANTESRFKTKILQTIQVSKNQITNFIIYTFTNILYIFKNILFMSIIFTVIMFLSIIKIVLMYHKSHLRDIFCPLWTELFALITWFCYILKIFFTLHFYTYALVYPWPQFKMGENLNAITCSKDKLLTRKIDLLQFCGIFLQRKFLDFTRIYFENSLIMKFTMHFYEIEMQIM